MGNTDQITTATTTRARAIAPSPSRRLTIRGEYGCARKAINVEPTSASPFDQA
jgi:hypothetical protein